MSGLLALLTRYNYCTVCVQQSVSLYSCMWSECGEAGDVLWSLVLPTRYNIVLDRVSLYSCVCGKNSDSVWWWLALPTRYNVVLFMCNLFHCTAASVVKNWFLTCLDSCESGKEFWFFTCLGCLVIFQGIILYYLCATCFIVQLLVWWRTDSLHVWAAVRVVKNSSGLFGDDWLFQQGIILYCLCVTCFCFILYSSKW